MIAIFYPGTPVAFARPNTKGKQRFTPDKQRAFAEGLSEYAAHALRGVSAKPLTGPLFLQLRATYSYPPSWTEKQKAATKFKTSKPDTDNLVKLAKDAMNKIVYRDDAQVVRVHAEKVYGYPEGLTITVIPLEEPDRLSEQAARLVAA